MKKVYPFSLGELWGPARCEHEGCGEPSWTIYMTLTEYRSLPDGDGRTAIVFREGIGTALCEDHEPPLSQLVYPDD